MGVYYDEDDLDQQAAAAKVADLLAQVDSLLKEVAEIARGSELYISWNGPYRFVRFDVDENGEWYSSGVSY